MADIARKQPLGRLGSVRDIADATVYLFSDAGSYVTGQTLVGKYLYQDIRYRTEVQRDSLNFYHCALEDCLSPFN
jgi:NAD(P)-dependent dehydrogenase (short-subunit alcohol dehydrogenase family)